LLTQEVKLLPVLLPVEGTVSRPLYLNSLA
jgi:hypothetical protein